MPNCPYCGKKLVEDERYCYFCEQDVEDRESYKNRPKKQKEGRGFLSSIVKYFKNLKKR